MVCSMNRQSSDDHGPPVGIQIDLVSVLSMFNISFSITHYPADSECVPFPIGLKISWQRQIGWCPSFLR